MQQHGFHAIKTNTITRPRVWPALPLARHLPGTPYTALLANGLHPRVLAGPQPARFIRRLPLLLVVEGGLLLDDFDWMSLFDDQRTHRALCHDWVGQKRPKSRVVAIQNANKHFS
jgi:hypothetical protein